MLLIRANMLAENAARQYKITTRKREKNAEKLASGYRINRAADDAAGLCMSETMRRLIRGLHKGSENITEGISLIKVADAALGEITDMLQRVNELSVQAYNGTNTPQDRQAIQAEVDQLLAEIGRTGETTTYNEIQILKWEPFFTREVQVTKDQIITLPVTVPMEKKKLPDWLDKKVDNDLQVGNYTGPKKQDTTETMVTIKRDNLGNIERNSDGTAKYIYYGPNYGNHYDRDRFDAEHAGSWTESLNNNATAKVSFAGLKDFTNFSDLYSGLVDLLGSGFGIPCGTCRAYEYGLAFTGTTDGISVKEIAPYYGSRSTPTLDLSGLKVFQDSEGKAVNCFEKIKDTLKQMTEDGKTEAEQSAEAQKLADEIAQALCKEAYRLMSGDQETKDHYTKSFQDGAYDIVVYDYRDDSALTWEHAADSTVRKWSQASMTYPADVLESGTWGTVDIPHDLYIVCSAQDSDDIPIKLPFISLEKLGIADYNVANYVRTEKYSNDYQKKLAEWEMSAYIESTPNKVTEPVYETKTEWLYINGEPIPKMTRTKIGDKEFTVWTNKKVYPTSKPQPKKGDIVVTEWYDPSDNRLIRDALLQVSMWRTNLGATQNRLEHTYNNNQNKVENLTAAESRIRDTDVAKEMVDFSNNSILQQAGVSMLANANQDRQMVLSLLQ